MPVPAAANDTIVQSITSSEEYSFLSYRFQSDMFLVFYSFDNGPSLVITKFGSSHKSIFNWNS